MSTTPTTDSNFFCVHSTLLKKKKKYLQIRGNTLVINEFPHGKKKKDLPISMIIDLKPNITDGGVLMSSTVTPAPSAASQSQQSTTTITTTTTAAASTTTTNLPPVPPRAAQPVPPPKKSGFAKLFGSKSSAPPPPPPPVAATTTAGSAASSTTATTSTTSTAAEPDLDVRLFHMPRNEVEFVMTIALEKNKVEKQTWLCEQRAALLGTLHSLMRTAPCHFDNVVRIQSDSVQQFCCNLTVQGADLLVTKLPSDSSATSPPPPKVYPLRDVHTIYRVVGSASHVVLHFGNAIGRLHHYIFSNHQHADSFCSVVVERITNFLGLRTIPTHTIDEQALAQIERRVTPTGAVTSFPVLPVRSSGDDTKKNIDTALSRFLFIGENHIYERKQLPPNVNQQDATAQWTISVVHQIRDIVTIVLDPTSNSRFSIEYRNDKTYQFSSVQRDFIVLNLQEATHRLGALRQAEPQQQQSCALSFLETSSGLREGAKGTTPNTDYAEVILLKRMALLDKLDEAYDLINLLKEFVMSFPTLGHLPCKDPRNILRAVIKQIITTPVVPGGVSSNMALVALLASLQRLLWRKACFEETNILKECVRSIVLILRESNDDIILYFAAAVLRDLVIKHAPVEDKFVAANRKLLFTPEIVEVFLSTLDRCFSHHAFLVMDALLALLATGFATEAGFEDSHVDKKVFDRLFNYRTQLYGFVESECTSLAATSSSIIGRLMRKGPTWELIHTVQNEVMRRGLLLRYLYNSIFGSSDSVKSTAAEMVDLICSGNDDAHSLMKRIIPAAFLRFIVKGEEEEIEPTESQPSPKLPEKRSGFSFFKKKSPPRSSSVPTAAVHFVNNRSQNWTEVLSEMQRDFSNPILIWNKQTRAELESVLSESLAKLNASRTEELPIAWNWLDFHVPYESLAGEYTVLGCYVRLLAETDPNDLVSIENPVLLATELYFALIQLSPEQIQHQLLHVKALCAVYTNYIAQAGTHIGTEFPHLPDIVQRFIAVEEPNVDTSLELLRTLSEKVEASSWLPSFCSPKNAIMVNLLVGQLVKNMSLIHNAKTKSERDLALVSLQTLFVLTEVILNKTSLNISATASNRSKHHVTPLPMIVHTIMRQPQHIGGIVGHVCMVDTSDSDKLGFASRGIKLLRNLYEIDDESVAHAHRLGLFPLLLRTVILIHTAGAGTTGIIEDIWGLLRLLHTRQKVEFQQYGITENPSNSLLAVWWPQALIARLVSEPLTVFTKTFFSEEDSPTLIWNREMRATVQAHTNSYLEQYVVKFAATLSHVPGEFGAMTPAVHANLGRELYLAGIYLSNLIDQSKWPSDSFQPPDSQLLLRQVIKTFKETPIEDIEHLRILIQSQNIVLGHYFKDRFEEKLGQDYEYEAWDTVISVINAHMISSSTWDPQFVDSIGLLVYILLKNAPEQTRAGFVKQEGHELLLSLASMCFSHFKAKTPEHHIFVLLRRLLESIYCICDVKAAREAFGANSRSAASLRQLLLFFIGNPLAGSTPTNIDTLMLGVVSSCLGVLSKLIVSLPTLDEFALHLWAQGLGHELFYMLLSVHPIQQVQQQKQTPSAPMLEEIKKKAVIVLSQLCVQSEQSNASVLQDVERLLPMVLANRIVPLAAAAPEQVSQYLSELLQNETESPELIWNNQTRGELYAHLKTVHSALKQADFLPSDPVAYDRVEYSSHQRELIVGGIFVRIFNKLCGDSISNGTPAPLSFEMTDLKSFLDALLANLQQQPLNGEGATNNGATSDLIVAAIYNVLACSKEHDSKQASGQQPLQFPSLLVLLLQQHRIVMIVRYLYAQLSSEQYQARTQQLQQLSQILRMLVRDTNNSFTEVVASGGVEGSDTSIGPLVVLLLSRLLKMAAQRFVTAAPNSTWLCDSLLESLTAMATANSVIVNMYLRYGVFLNVMLLFCGENGLSIQAPHTTASRTKAAQLLSAMTRDTKLRATVLLSIQRFFPPALSKIVSADPSKAVSNFQEYHVTPELLWTEKMRGELKQALVQQLANYETATQHVLQPDFNGTVPEWTLDPSFFLEYEDVKAQLKIGGVFVRLYNEQYSTHTLQDPQLFVNELASFLVEPQESTPAQSKAEALRALQLVLTFDKRVDSFIDSQKLAQCASLLFALACPPSTDTTSAILIIFKLAKSHLFITEVVRQRLVRNILEALASSGNGGSEEQLLTVLLVLCRASSDIVTQLMEGQHSTTLLMLMSHDNKNVQLRAAHVFKTIALNPIHARSLPLDKVPAEFADVPLPTQDELNWSIGAH